MLNIGCHLSVSNGYYNMGKDALSIGANTFQYFTRNPRGGAKKEVSQKDIESLIKLMETNNFTKIIAHAPYTLNLCSSNLKTRNFGKMIFEDDIKFIEKLPNSYYNFHPGFHVGQGIECGINEICNVLNKVIKKEQHTIILLETMSGKGSEIGGNFEQIKAILDKVKLCEKVGVCFDTCHVFDAGYDIVNDLDNVLNEFDKIIGLNKLYAVHLNDSLNTLGSKKDRHALIGQGNIGIKAIENIINHKKLKNLPFILETPNDLQGYKKEIAFLKSKYKN